MSYSNFNSRVQAAVPMVACTSKEVRTAQWVLLNILHNSKKRWRGKAYTRPSLPQQVSEEVTISHVERDQCSPGSQATALVHHNRLNGCLLPCSNYSKAQAIYPLCISESSLSVQSASIWSFSIPTSLHQVYGSSVGSNTGQRASGASIPGRLASLLSLSGASSGGNHTTALPYCTAGQFQLEPVNPNSVSEVHWCYPGLTIDDSLAIRTAGGQYSAAPPAISKADQATTQVFPQTHGYAGSGSCSLTIGPPFASIFPEMGEQFSSESQWAQEQVDQNYTARPSHTETMEEEVISDQSGCSGKDSLSAGGSPDRCFFNRLGRYLAA